MFKKILLCVDDSPLSDRIAHVGADIARRYRAETVILSVLDPARFARPPYSGLEAIAMIDRHSRSLTDNGYRLSTQLQESGIAARVLFLPGRTSETILEVAHQEKVDLIVMGGESKGRLRSLLEGNLWSDVSRAAPCNVLRVNPEGDTSELSNPMPTGKPSDQSVPAAASARHLVNGLG